MMAARAFLILLSALLAPHQATSNIILDDVNGTTFALETTTTETLSVVSTQTLDHAFSCAFETGLCGWVQNTKDDFDWTRHRGPTPSTTSGTGPSVDHTTGTVKGWYMYIEASGANQGDSASLDYHFPSLISNGCFSMYYHMYGSNIGALMVESVSSTGLRQTLWITKGNHNDEWLQMTIQIKQTDTISIVAQAANGLRGDIAIDDIRYTTGSCPQEPLNCTFNNDLCGWKQVTTPADSLDWRPISGETPSRDTGPLRYFGDQYLYIEASTTKQGDTASLIYTFDKPVDSGCLSLSYNMNGIAMGTLSVEGVGLDSTVRKLWSLSGDQGNEWHRLFAPIQDPTQSLSISGVMTGLGYHGDIAIDDVAFTTSECPGENINCTFHYGRCGWRQENLDDFNWLVGDGATKSVNTGPLTDNTGDSGYLYIEASQKRIDSVATIKYRFNAPVNKGCFSLNYHMYGLNMGSLQIKGRAVNSTISELWSLAGNQGDKWYQLHLPIRQQILELQITGKVGSGFKSDIAIDDITFTSGLCPGDVSKFEQCQKNQAIVADPATGNGVLTMYTDGAQHQLALPVGKYPYLLTTDSGVKCSILVTVYDSRVVQRLEYEALYPTNCSVLSNPVTKEMVMSSASGHSDVIKQLCAGDCTADDQVYPELSCENNVMVIRWPTQTTFKANTTIVPPELQNKLSKRILDGSKGMLKIVISTNIPPIVYPTANKDGSSAKVVLRPDCTSGRFNEMKASCE